MSGLSDQDKKKLRQANIINKWRIYKMIPVGELQIPEYQRKAIRLQMLVKALYNVGNQNQPVIDLDFFGALNVTENIEDGGYDIDNGQRRTVLLLCKMLAAANNMPMEEFNKIEIPCLVSTAKTMYKDRAKKFWLFNGGGNASKGLSKEQFKAQVEAEMADALYYESVIKKAELACGEVNNITDGGNAERQIAWKTLDKALGMGSKFQNRKKAHEDRSAFWVEKIANLFKKAWGPGQMDNQLFNGFAHLVNHPHYQLIFLTEKKYDGKTIWEKLVEHIEKVAKTYSTPKRYVETFQKYKNISDWSLGIAYGIVEHFAGEIGGKGIRAKQLRDEYYNLLKPRDER
jgi:hypothetical protein